MATYIIGDIHGCNRTLNALIQQLAITSSDKVVFLGDLIDRGPDSKGVVDTVWALQADGVEVVCLRGNHEQMLIDGLTNASWQISWLRNGGAETLASFGIEELSDMPEAYVHFFEETRLWYEVGDYLCVHAGLNFAAKDPLADSFSILWIREWYQDISYKWLGKRIILHGHTPMPIGFIEMQWHHLTRRRYLNLDNGCVYGMRKDRQGLGNLLALHVEECMLYAHPYVG